MTTPQFNFPLFAQVWAWVMQQSQINEEIREKNPDAKDGDKYVYWNQGVWRQVKYDTGQACGTRICFAGYATHLSGAKYLDDIASAEYVYVPVNMDTKGMWVSSLDNGGRAMSIEAMAILELGLAGADSDGYSWSERLFSPSNDFEDIDSILNEMFEHYGLLPQWQAAKEKELATA